MTNKMIKVGTFLVAILDKNTDFRFPEKIKSNVILKDLLKKEVGEKYYLTNYDYLERDNKRIFKNKNRNDIEYEVDMNKCSLGGVCGIDKHSKFAISSRLFSIWGNSPTLTASNTPENCKIIVESGDE